MGNALVPRLKEQGIKAIVLQVSKGFAFSWDPRRPAGSRVVPGSVALDGRALDPGASYRVTVNSFNWGGGDGLTVLREGRDVVRSGLARDALERYVARHAPVAPVTDRRARNVSESD